MAQHLEPAGGAIRETDGVALEVDDAAGIDPLGGDEGHESPAPHPCHGDLEPFGKEIAELQNGVVGDGAALGG